MSLSPKLPIHSPISCPRNDHVRWSLAPEISKDSYNRTKFTSRVRMPNTSLSLSFFLSMQSVVLNGEQFVALVGQFRQFDTRRRERQVL